MTTIYQKVGELGENIVQKKIGCPRCKRRGKTLKILPTNFKAVDLICDFCGYLAQVKSQYTDNINELPNKLAIRGAAWGVHLERMDAGIFHPLFIVLINRATHRSSIYYLPSDLQTRDMFHMLPKLKPPAKRAGFQGVMIHVHEALSTPIKLT